MRALSALLRWSLRNRPVVLFATLIFIAVGLYCGTRLPIDAVPDLTGIQVQVVTSAQGLSPVEVEKYVSIPVERAMAGLPFSTQVRSLSRQGISVVTIVFSDDTDIYRARQLVAERMPQVQQVVGDLHGRPEMAPITTALGEVFQFTVTSDTLSLMELSELLVWNIAPQLRTVPGVVDVNSFGGESRQYEVVLDPQRLHAAHISVNEVAEALLKSNVNTGGGYLEYNREHFVIGTQGLISSLDDLSRVVVGATDRGVPITVATVGEARFAPSLRYGAASMDGRGEVVVGVALMLMGDNARRVTDGIKKKLAEIAPSLPPGTRIEPFYDRSALINRTIRTVSVNLAEGALLVIGVLFLLLNDLRAGFVVATAVPLSLLFAVVFMQLTGQSGNLMSLGAIDFGLIVDGAVIIVENVVRRMGDMTVSLSRPLTAQERVGVVEEATLEVRSASIFGEAIIAIVYLPILSLSGMEGKLFRPMALTVLFALLGAFILSLTVIPVLASYFVRGGPHHHETWLLRHASRLYQALFGRLAKVKGLAFGGAFALVALALVTLFQMGAEFVPQLDEGDMLVEARRLPDVALSQSVELDIRAERALLQIPEVVHAVGRVGAPALALDPMGLSESDIYMALKPREEWRSGITKADLASEVSEVLERAVPEVAGSLSQPIEMRTNELVAGVRSDIAALIYGPDLEVLSRLAGEVARRVDDVLGAVDVRVEQLSGIRYLRIIPDRVKLARYALTLEDVGRITETIAVGYQVGEVLEGERRFPLMIKLQTHYEGDLEALRALPLKSVTGHMIPLGDVADLQFVTGPVQVSRHDQSRRVTVQFNVRGRDMLSVARDAAAAISDLTVPVGYRIEWGGQFEHYAEAKARLFVAVPLCFMLIAFLLWLAFRSAFAAFFIFLNIPFAVVGGVFALALRGIAFSISAGIGFIALFGVAVLNGLVLIAFTRQLEAAGEASDVAITKAARLRLRPVLMTSLVAALGFLPMAISTAPGSEVQRPLATVVIGGLTSATILTLFLLPLAYPLGRQAQARLSRRFKKTAQA